MLLVVDRVTSHACFGQILLLRFLLIWHKVNYQF